MAIIKTKEEIENIKKACMYTDMLFKEIVFYVKKNTSITERQLEKYIKDTIRLYNLKPSFPPIVTSGKNAGNEIHPKSQNTLLSGFVIIDIGVKYNGYCSDMTRMLYIGSPTESERNIYQKIKNVQNEVIQKVQIEVYPQNLDMYVRKSLGKYKKYFIHTLGHGVGKKIHEAPVLYEKREEAPLLENTVITIEPGIYIPNTLGIRIEDTIVVKNKKAGILTKSSKQLIVIK